MDIILEIIISELINNNKIPKIIRYLTVTIIHFALILLFSLIAINCLNDSNYIGFILLLFIDLLFLVTFIVLIKKINKSINEKEVK